MRVLVTGHRGYLGTVLVPTLLERGHQVHGVDSGLFANCAVNDGIRTIPGWEQDIRDIKQSQLRGFDAVIHLAGLSNDPLGDLSPKTTHEINYLASLRLAQLARDAKIQRFLFASTCSVYGAGGDALLDEESEIAPLTPYALSKARAERGISGLANINFSPTFLRCATACGVSPMLRFDLVLNNLVAWARTTGTIYVKSDGMAWRPIVHVEDICRAFVCILEAPRSTVHNQIFNVGLTENNYRVNELARIIAQTVPDSFITYASNGASDPRCYRVNCDKIRQAVGFEYQPQWSVEKSCQELFLALNNYHLEQEDIEGPRYGRVAHLKQLIAHGILDPSLRVPSGPMTQAA